MLVITLVGNVPLNQQTLNYPADDDSDDRAWRAMRSRWERLHVARVALDLVAFGCLSSALADDALPFRSGHECR